MEVAERSPTMARDPLVVSQLLVRGLTQAIRDWNLHMMNFPAHDPKKCGECARFFKEARDTNTTIGYRLMDSYHRPVRVCAREGCGNEFNPGSEWQKYCSHRCRQSAYHRRKSGKFDLRD